MSDTDDGGFDKEAEREKLRKKFEEEEESRRATQQMSELLLKGATMTNRHCGECGNPIFRQDDREFCPTCGETVEEGAEEEPIDVSAETADSPDEPDVAASSAGAEPTESASNGDAGTGPRVSPARAAEAGTGDAFEPGDERAPDREAPERAAPAGDELGEARASLVRTLTDLAHRAENATDVRRTRDLLGAAREAAEAVEALDRAER